MADFGPQPAQSIGHVLFYSPSYEARASRYVALVFRAGRHWLIAFHVRELTGCVYPSEDNDDGRHRHGETLTMGKKGSMRKNLGSHADGRNSPK